MKYSDIINLHDYFLPAYDLENEIKDYWKRFIPTDQLYEILDITLNSINSNFPSEKKSIWIQGNYGTGKSHATAVVMHLLSDDINKIEDYIRDLKDQQIKNKLYKFRESKKIFPVVIKGVSLIDNSISFSREIQKAVKKSLEMYNLHNKIKVKTDFEQALDIIKNNELNVNWDTFIRNSIELFTYVKSEEELISEIEKNDIEILNYFEKELEKKGLSINIKNISSWLNEVASKLKENNIADSVIIFWDEFTSFFELNNADILLTELQHIAELSKKGLLYLYIVSHRVPQIYDDMKKDYDKVSDRFKLFEFKMEDITTYEIIESSIKVINSNKIKDIRFKYAEILKEVIERISLDENIKKNKIIELLPIHPFSAYLSIFISKYLGSTERSIFNFLFDDKKGFRYFINNFPYKNIYLLTADFLWDYFESEFSKVNKNDLTNILNHYNMYKDSLKKINEKYLPIFKVLLLLNVLIRKVQIFSSSLIKPIKDILNMCFEGTEIKSFINLALSYFEEKHIFVKNPEGLYLVAGGSFDEREVIDKIREIKQSIEKEGIIDILDIDIKEKIKNELFKSNLRKTKVELFNYRDLISKTRFDKLEFKGNIIIILVFPKDEFEKSKIIKKIKNELTKEYKHFIFCVIDNIFNKNDMDAYLNYKANSEIAKNHSNFDLQTEYEGYAKEKIKKWYKEIEDGYINYYLDDIENKILTKNFVNLLKEKLSEKIYKFGIEKLLRTKNNQNLWKEVNSRKALEIFIKSKNRRDLEEKTKNALYRGLREILKDNNGEYIVDESLNFKEDIDEYHPLIVIKRKVDSIIVNKNSIFNLGEELKFLKSPPFGVYKCHLYFALIAFIMRDYINKIYESGYSQNVDSDLMIEKIEILFKYFDNPDGNYSKLDLRIGSEKEKELTNILIKIFKLSDGESYNLNKVKWEIREFFEKINIPIVLLKYKNTEFNNKNKIVELLIKFVNSTDDSYNDEEIGEYLVNFKENVNDIINLINNNDLYELINNFNKSKMIEEEIEDFNALFNCLRKYIQEKISLWNEDKLESAILRCLKNKTEDVITDFIIVLEEIFNIEMNKENFENNKEKINNWLNQKNIPNWALKYILDDDELLIFNKVLDILELDEHNLRKTIESYINLLKEKSNDIKTKLNNFDLKNFIINILNKNNLMKSDFEIVYNCVLSKIESIKLFETNEQKFLEIIENCIPIKNEKIKIKNKIKMINNIEMLKVILNNFIDKFYENFPDEIKNTIEETLSKWR